MQEYRISVCMATYNGERYVIKQVRSILDQLADDDELVIFEDSSTDTTLRLIENIASNDNRVIVIAGRRNVGVIRAFELALEASSLDLIVLSDQDDIWLPGKVNSLRKNFKDPEVSAVLSNAVVFGRDREKDALFFPVGYLPRLSLRRLFIRNEVIGCCLAFRRAVLRYALPVPRSVSMHDWWLGVVSTSTGKMVYDPEPRVLYRRHDRNASPSVSRSLPKILLSRIGNACAIFILIKRLVVGSCTSRYRSDGI